MGRGSPLSAQKEAPAGMAPDSQEKISVYQQVEQENLSLDSGFRFHCREGLACFNQCCRRTPTIILSPYDILRLKQCLGLRSGEFLRRYTLREIEEWSNLPLVFLDPYGAKDGGCPFIGPQGCLVYAHRPAACRLFPITMGSRLTEQGIRDYYFCRQLDYCQGFDADVQWTVESWMAHQGFAEYAQGRKEWLEIILTRGVQGPSGVDAPLQDLFATIAYDLDTWRTLLEQPGFLKACGLKGKGRDYRHLDDAALLEVGYKCLQGLVLA
jgi:Fe-S-cluster containining protein